MFLENSAVALIIVEDVRFHKLAFFVLVVGALLTLAIVSEFIDWGGLLFLLLYILVDFGLSAGKDDGPYDEEGEPKGENYDSNDCKGVSLVFREIVDLAVPEVECDFHVLF